MLENTIYIVLFLLSFYILLDVVFFRPRAAKEKSIEIMKKVKNVKPVNRNYNNTGIVMISDSDNSTNCLLTVTALRKIGCNLDIIIYGESDQRLSKYAKLDKKCTMTEAIINSPFSEILYIEPGVLFLENPSTIFSNEEYQKTGALFWKENFNLNIVKNIVPYIESNKKTINSFFVINKNKHLKGLSVMSSLKNYDIPESELCWISFELALEPYHFIESSDYNYNGLKIHSLFFQIDSPEQLDNTTPSIIQYFKNFNDDSSKLKNIFNMYRKLSLHFISDEM
jgi:hypothetical protein